MQSNTRSEPHERSSKINDLSNRASRHIRYTLTYGFTVFSNVMVATKLVDDAYVLKENSSIDPSQFNEFGVAHDESEARKKLVARLQETHSKLRAAGKLDASYETLEDRTGLLDKT
jgi:hypothetical protein